MSNDRLPDTILRQAVHIRGLQAPQVDPSKIGSMGAIPIYNNITNDTPYVRKQLQLRLMRAPGFFSVFGIEEEMRLTAILKRLIEVAPLEVTGFNKTISIETAETPIGGAGEMLEVVSNTTRARSTPSLQYNEKANRAIGNFWEWYARWGMMDPELKKPLISTLVDITAEDSLADFYGFSVLAWEPDPLNKKVVTSWLSTAMFPKSMPNVEGIRNLTSGGDKLDFSIELAAVTQVGEAVDLVAQFYMDEANVAGGNPAFRAALRERITANVAAAEVGYNDQLRAVAARIGAVA